MLKIVVAVLSALLSVQALAEAKVLAEDGNVVVTQEDVDRYIAYNFPPEKRAGAYADFENLLRYVQNLYLVRKMAQEVDTYDEEQYAWQVQYLKETWLAQEAQRLAVIEAQKKVDWESLAKERYVAERDNYQTKARVNAAHILIKPEGRTEIEALALANELRDRARNGEDFNELALQYSEDGSAGANKGELGTFTFGKMVEPFARAAFALREPGQISEPVKSPFGYHVIKLNQYYPSEYRAFDEIKSVIIEGLKADVAVRTKEDRVVELRSSNEVELDLDAIEAMVQKPDVNLN